MPRYLAGRAGADRKSFFNGTSWGVVDHCYSTHEAEAHICATGDRIVVNPETHGVIQNREGHSCKPIRSFAAFPRQVGGQSTRQ